MTDRRFASKQAPAACSHAPSRRWTASRPSRPGSSSAVSPCSSGSGPSRARPPTPTRSQAELIERLVADEPATVVSGGELEVPVGDGTIEVDVMDLADDPLPGDPERRAFALARRYVLDTAVTERVVVTDGESVVVDAHIPVASTAALVALETVAMVRRPHGNSPHKIGSDIHDLVRLVSGTGARALATELIADGALATWVGEQVHRAFGSDVRYTLLRLRTNDRSAGAQALGDAEIEATGILADELTEQLDGQ